MADVFVSYLRKDKDFVRQVHDALVQLRREEWVDWEDIPLTAEWLQEIYAGIDISRTEELAPSTINVRLAAVRRLAYEASDTGLLNPELAAGIRRVKGAKRLGVRIENWLSVDQSKTLLRQPAADDGGKRDRAILARLIGCGLRLVGLRMRDYAIWQVANLSKFSFCLGTLRFR